MNNTTESPLHDEDIKTIGKLFIPLRVFGKFKKIFVVLLCTFDIGIIIKLIIVSKQRQPMLHLLAADREEWPEVFLYAMECSNRILLHR